MTPKRNEIPIMRPFFSYHMPSFTFAGTEDDHLFDRVVELAQAADRAGFDMVTVMDHFYQIGVVGSEEEPMLEGYSTLAAIATQTRNVMLGTMVTGVTYRNPAMLAKTVTTLDVISKGRAVLGIGAAWNDVEHAGYGFEYPPIGEREDRLEEALTIAKAMFTEERPSFEGKYYRIDRAWNNPRPIRPGGPKILVGGGGEKRTLKIAARFADITNWFGTLEEAAPKLGVLDRHCEAIGRDPSEITRTVAVSMGIVESEREKASFLARIPADKRGLATVSTLSEGSDILHKYLDAGFDGLTFRNLVVRTPEDVARIGELIGTMRKEGVPA
jgi:F420-dependent oxidoreductase-like protein